MFPSMNYKMFCSIKRKKESALKLQVVLLIQVRGKDGHRDSRQRTG